MVVEKPANRTGDFEFSALNEAENYRRALLAEFSPFLGDQVIEIGSGIGQFSELLSSHPSVNHLICVEPDPEFCREHRARLNKMTLVEGTVDDLPAAAEGDAIVSVNVLEHIEQDETELSAYSRILRARRGALCLFVPARKEIYAPLDRDFGHFRRYSKAELRAKLGRAGFKIQHLSYFNFVGYFAWWLNFRLLGSRSFNPGSVRFFDRVVFPVVHRMESSIARPPFGQSLLAIARAGEESINSASPGSISWVARPRATGAGSSE
jgi:SAM-dependent methyltransferase